MPRQTTTATTTTDQPGAPRELAREPARKTLTDRFLRSLKQSAFTGRRIVYDTEVRGFGVHVLKSQLSFVLVARPPGRKQPTRMALGEYAGLTPTEHKAADRRYKALPADERAKLSFDEYLLQTYGPVTLAGGREKARLWKRHLRAGIDPRVVEARERATAQAAAGNLFGAVTENFITRELSKQRRGHVVERILRKEVLPGWKGRPIADVGHRDVREVVDKVVERGAPRYAHNVFDAIRAVFAFAVDRGILDASPCAMLKPAKIIGAKAIRTRVLSDSELRAVAAVANELDYPFGRLVQVLLLTGCRLNEVAGARWPEFDLEARTWTIPAERFKSGAQHVVPVADDLMAVLDGLPRFHRGDHLFSSTFGQTPVSGFAKAKARIDKRVGAVPRWTFHDIRRTVRTRLAELRVPDHIAEIVIGHARKGLARIYDQHKYAAEVRDALTLWAARLHSIVSPPPATNVVEMQQHKAAS